MDSEVIKEKSNWRTSVVWSWVLIKVMINLKKERKKDKEKMSKVIFHCNGHTSSKWRSSSEVSCSN